MALLSGDFSVAVNGDVRSVAGATTHHVLELHRWLMSLLTSATSGGDDLLDVTVQIIPSTRKTDEIIILNAPYNLDDATAQRFYGGSITQLGGNDQYSGLAVLGSVNSPTTELMIIQNGAVLPSHWGTGINTGPNILSRMLIKSRSGGVDIDGKRILIKAHEWGDTYAEFPVTLKDGEATGAIITQADDLNTTAIGTIAGYADITNTEGLQGLDLNNGNGPQDYYSQWTRGSRTTSDLWERAKWLTRRGSVSSLYGISGELFRGVTHSWDYDNELLGPYTQGETLSWGAGVTAGTGVLLALDDQGAIGTLYIQLMTGVAPVDNAQVTGGISGATSDVNLAPTERIVSPVFLGAYSGSLGGAYGLGVVPGELVKGDKLRDLLNVVQTPPDNVPVEVTRLAIGDVVFSARTRTNTYTTNGVHNQGDLTYTVNEVISALDPQPGRVKIDGTEHAYLSYAGSVYTLAEPLKAGVADLAASSVESWIEDQFTLALGNNLGNGTLVVNEVIGQDNPASGEIRVWNGVSFDRYAYSSFAGSTFQIPATLSANYTQNDNCFVPFIDEIATATSISKTVVYPTTDIQARHRVYNDTDMIVPFEVGFTVGPNGSSTQAIRGADA